MLDVIEMKSNRRAIAGVDYGQIAEGKLVLVPAEYRLAAIAKDHKDAMDGGMPYKEAKGFETIFSKLAIAKKTINSSLPIN